MDKNILVNLQNHKKIIELIIFSSFIIFGIFLMSVFYEYIINDLAKYVNKLPNDPKQVIIYMITILFAVGVFFIVSCIIPILNLLFPKKNSNIKIRGDDVQ